MSAAEVIAIATGFSCLFFGVFKFLLSKVQGEFRTFAERLSKAQRDFRDDLDEFQKEIGDKIAALDKSLAVKASMLDYLYKEIEEIKKRVNDCKQCRGIDS